MSRLPGPLYWLARHALPIACVDVVPVAEREGALHVGLIRRRGPRRGETGWAMVGGRVLHDEPLAEAVARHLRVTLGVSPLSPPSEPATVAEYFMRDRPGRLWDPRKHAVAVTYVVPVEGEPAPRGEALSFGWHPRERLPPAGEWVYGHDRVVELVLG